MNGRCDAGSRRERESLLAEIADDPGVSEGGRYRLRAALSRPLPAEQVEGGRAWLDGLYPQ
jgi:hypothetical protein